MPKHIGFSLHDKPELLDQILTEHPEMDFVQLQINCLDWDDPTVQARRCYEIARKHGKPILVMEPLKGGGLANLPRLRRKNSISCPIRIPVSTMVCATVPA